MASIREKKDKDGKVRAYKIVVTLGRDERNKKVYVSTTIPRPEGLTPKREEREVQRIANEWEHTQRMEYESNRNAVVDRNQKKKIKVSEFIDEFWIKRHVDGGNHTPNTRSFYRQMAEDIKKYFKSDKPDLRLVDVSKNDVLDYLYYLRNVAKTRGGKPYSPATIQHHFNTFSSILEYAVYIEFLNENPCRKLRPSDRPKREDRDVDFLEEDDAIRFISCLDSEKEAEYWRKHSGSLLQWKTLVNFMIVTGMRRGELVGLQWGDLDKKNMILRISRNITIDTSNKEEKESKKKIHVGATKGKRIRKIPVTRHLVNLLDELKVERTEYYGEEPGKGDYIFCRDKEPSLPLYPTEPTRMVKKYIRRHGLPNVSPHDLRHTAATLAIQSGANIKEVQALLGHKDASTTLQFYAGISEKTRRETIEGIEGMIHADTK